MRIRCLSAAAAVAIVGLASGSPAHGAARVEQRAYGVSPITWCSETADLPLEGGGACFELLAEDTTAAFTIADDVSDAVSASVRFYRPAEEQPAVPLTALEEVGSAHFCSASGEIAIPEGAVVATVAVDDAQTEVAHNAYPTLHDAAAMGEPLPAPDPSPCGLGTGATTGTIVAELS